MGSLAPSTVLANARLGAERLSTHAKEILSREEFQSAPSDSTFFKWHEAALERIGEWLSKLFNVADPRILSPVATAVLVGALAAALILLAWLIVRMLPSKQKATEELDLETERRAVPEQLLGWAEEAELGGDFARAFRLLFWALLKFSDRAGWVRYSDDLTNWEVYQTHEQTPGKDFWQEARKHGVLFDHVLYGGGSVDPNDVQSLRRLVHVSRDYKVAA